MNIRPEKGTRQYYVSLEQYDGFHVVGATGHDLYEDKDRHDFEYDLGHTLGDAVGRLWDSKFLAFGALATAIAMLDQITGEEEFGDLVHMKEETEALYKMIEGAREFAELRKAFWRGE